MSQQIYKKMSEVMKEIGFIGKDQKNQAQGFKFRGVDQFVNSLYPALTKHGVFMTPRCVNERYEIKEVTRSSGKQGFDKLVTIMMEYDFYAEDGSKVTVGPIPAEGLDSGDKATNKALSAALKYALIQTFSIPTEDMAEADLDSPEIGKTSRADVSKVEQDLNIKKFESVTSGTITGGNIVTNTNKTAPSFRRPTKPTTTVVTNSGDDL
jgi:ERF superfamily